MIRLVVFDMAGTTVDENNVVYKTIQKAFRQAGYDVSLDLVLQNGAGKEKLQAVKDILREVFGVINDELAQGIHAVFKTSLVDTYRDLDVRPVNGANDLFRYLKQHGIAVALNTGYDGNTALGLLRKLGWEDSGLIDAVVTATDVPRSRPFPDMIRLAMFKTGIGDPQEVVKIGDSTVDIEEGQNAKCRFSIGITGGAQTREQLLLQHPDFVIDQLSELIAIIERENKKADLLR
jgi:phosphonatase-like hydrolase